jgi:hypothetical protein
MCAAIVPSISQYGTKPYSSWPAAGTGEADGRTPSDADGDGLVGAAEVTLGDGDGVEGVPHAASTSASATAMDRAPPGKGFT